MPTTYIVTSVANNADKNARCATLTLKTTGVFSPEEVDALLGKIVQLTVVDEPAQACPRCGAEFGMVDYGQYEGKRYCLDCVMVVVEESIREKLKS
jgi:hypothetical protein